MDCFHFVLASGFICLLAGIIIFLLYSLIYYLQYPLRKSKPLVASLSNIISEKKFQRTCDEIDEWNKEFDRREKQLPIHISKISICCFIVWMIINLVYSC